MGRNPYASRTNHNSTELKCYPPKVLQMWRSKQSVQIWSSCQLYTKLCFRRKYNVQVRRPNSSHTRYARAIISSIDCECNQLMRHKSYLLMWIQKVFWTRWFFTQMKLLQHFIQCFLQSSIDPFIVKEHPEFILKLSYSDLIIHLHDYLKNYFFWLDL